MVSINQINEQTQAIAHSSTVPNAISELEKNSTDNRATPKWRTDIAPKRHLPSGEDQDQYRKYETWTTRRWAWEFLRRNQEFQHACKTVSDTETGREHAKQIAIKFGLLRYKHWREQYGTGNQRPSFATGRQRIEVRVGSEENPKKISVKLRNNQALVMIEITPVILNKSFLDTQIQRIRNAILKELNAANINLKTTKPRVKSPNTLLKLLRTIDLGRTGGRSREEIFDLANDIQKTTRLRGSGASNKDRIDSDLDAAKTLMKSEYLFLAAPKKRSIEENQKRERSVPITSPTIPSPSS